MLRPTRSFRGSNIVLTLALLTCVGACDSTTNSEDQVKSDKPAAATGDAPSLAGDTPSPASSKVFDKEQRKRACEMLPAALVAKTLELPEAELKQMKIGGCLYEWESADETQVAEASVMLIWVMKDAAAARSYFETTTTNRTVEELRAEMAKVQGTAKADEKVDTVAEEKVVDQVGGAISMMLPEQGFQFEDVADLGDAARVLTHDGKLTVLVGNMVFNVEAFKGEASPKPDMAGAADMNQMIAAAKVAEDKWMEATRTQRKQQAIELGKAIVAGL